MLCRGRRNVMQRQRNFCVHSIVSEQKWKLFLPLRIAILLQQKMARRRGARRAHNLQKQIPTVWGYVLIVVAVVAVVVDDGLLPRQCGVEQHRYHGLGKQRSVPQDTTQPGFELRQEGVYVQSPRGCVDTRNRSYVTVRLRHSIELSLCYTEMTNTRQVVYI